MMENIYPPVSKRAMSRVVAIVAASILMSGCASAPPPPTEQMAVSRAAISNAASAGSSEFAPQQFKSATEKMDAAEQAMTREKYGLAKTLAEQAQVDAQLAVAVTRSVKAQKAADAVQEDNRILRQEMNRKTE